MQNTNSRPDVLLLELGGLKHLTWQAAISEQFCAQMVWLMRLIYQSRSSQRLVRFIQPVFQDIKDKLGPEGLEFIEQASRPVGIYGQSFFN